MSEVKLTLHRPFHIVRTKVSIAHVRAVEVEIYLFSGETWNGNVLSLTMLLLEKIKFILKIWTKLATHIRMRDRSVKIFQYGSQMLLGFYSSQMSAMMVESLSLTRRTASTSRKAFWMMKSINHVGTIIDMVEGYDWLKDEGYANFLDIVEQIALVVYYWYETLVFFTRVKLVSFTEQSIDGWGNMSWFLEDLVCLVASLIRTFVHLKKMNALQVKIPELMNTDLINISSSADANKSNDYIKYNVAESDDGPETSSSTICDHKFHDELSRMNVRLFDLLLSVIIVSSLSISLYYSISNNILPCMIEHLRARCLSRSNRPIQGASRQGHWRCRDGTLWSYLVVAHSV